MTTAVTLAVGLLAGVGVYLLLSRRVFSVILGLSLLTHAANLVVLTAGDSRERPPIVVDGVERQLLADPIPQALVLTAIVISMAVTLYMLATFAAGSRLATGEQIGPAKASDADRDPSSVERELAGQGREPS